MSDKLQELTDRIDREGVEKAEAEAKKILDDAENRGRDIVEAAERKAKEIVNRGRAQAESIGARGRSELAMASRQARNALKQRMTDLLSDAVLDEGIASTLDEKTFLAGIISDLVSKWDVDNLPPELSVILPEKKRKELDDYLKKALSEDGTASP